MAKSDARRANESEDLYIGRVNDDNSMKVIMYTHAGIGLFSSVILVCVCFRLYEQVRRTSTVAYRALVY